MPLPDMDAGVGHSFGLEFDGVQIKSITEVSGLKMEQDVIELKQNTPDGKFMIKKLPGRPKAGEVTLEGTVEDRQSKRLAEDLAQDGGCPGRTAGSHPVADHRFRLLALSLLRARGSLSTRSRTPQKELPA